MDSDVLLRTKVWGKQIIKVQMKILCMVSVPAEILHTMNLLHNHLTKKIPMVEGKKEKKNKT